MSRILLDLDGVCCNWSGAVSDVVFRHTGEPLDLSKWFERKDLPKEVRGKVMAEIAGPGFCFKFDPLPGAKEAVDELRAAGCDVQFVTSLWDCPTWVYDRNRWLRKHGFCAAPSGVTYTKDKWVVYGDIFVDDKVSNVLAWRKAWPGHMGIVWAQPWNADYEGPLRFNNWRDLVDLARSQKKLNDWASDPKNYMGQDKAVDWSAA